MEVRIKHPVVEAGAEYSDPSWQFDANQPHIEEAPKITSAGNPNGYVDIETNDWDFDDMPVEFHEEQPTKAATKWVNEFKKNNPDAVKTWPAADKTTKQ